MVISIVCKEDLHLELKDYESLYKIFKMGVIAIDEHHLVLKTDDVVDVTDETNVISESVNNIWDYVAYMSQMAA
jgi:hypothetical protein